MADTKLVICEKCWGTGHVHGGEENSTWSKTCEDCRGIGFVRVPMTNADHIRSMSDEELAKFLLEIMSNSVCFGEGMFPYHPCPQEQDCEKCGLGWLKQPYKEAPNDPT